MASGVAEALAPAFGDVVNRNGEGLQQNPKALSLELCKPAALFPCLTRNLGLVDSSWPTSWLPPNFQLWSGERVVQWLMFWRLKAAA